MTKYIFCINFFNQLIYLTCNSIKIMTIGSIKSISLFLEIGYLYCAPIIEPALI